MGAIFSACSQSYSTDFSIKKFLRQADTFKVLAPRFLFSSCIRINIFLNANRNSGYEAYESLGIFLKYRGLTNKQFDLRSDTMPNNVYNFSTVEPKSPYSVFHNPGPKRIQKGDYLIILPTAFYGSVSELRTDAFGKTTPGACSLKTTKDYDLVFHTETPWAFPWNAWDIEGLKNFIHGSSKQPTHYCGVDLNYYVLVHR